jgi:D-alanine-D-alanine ligase
LKIAVLYDTWEGTEEYPGAELEKRGSKRRRPKLDREEIFDALGKIGHEPFYQVIDGSSGSLAALAKCKADLFFNLTESFAGDDSMDVNIAAYLELVGKSYTGSGLQGLLLAQDKGLAKKVMRFHDIHSPYFAISYKGRIDHAHDIQFPLIVKPMNEDGSIGIDSNAVVSSIKELMERIDFIQEQFDSPALIEEFIEGREIYAAILGNERPEALPLIELDLSRLPDGTPKVAGFDVKYEKDSEAYRVTKSVIAELDEETTARIQQVAIDAFRALKLRDYARIDMRLRDDGRVYVIEANPNPWLASSAEYAMAARQSGRTYAKLVGDIVECALQRRGAR